MKAFRGSAGTVIDAAPSTVFDLLVDIDRLPEWNVAIEAVVERPAELCQGATWTVRMHPPRSPRWGSISRVQTIDRQRLCFAYETRNTDGNPSRVEWAWQVTDRDGAAEVTVAWVCHLATAGRRLVAGPIRKRALAREVPQSLADLRQVVVRVGAPSTRTSGA